MTSTSTSIDSILSICNEPGSKVWSIAPIGTSISWFKASHSASVGYCVCDVSPVALPEYPQPPPDCCLRKISAA